MSRANPPAAPSPSGAPQDPNRQQQQQSRAPGGPAQVPGTTVRDLMQRMGHDNERAAMIYLHATQGADRRIADSLPVQLEGRS